MNNRPSSPADDAPVRPTLWDSPAMARRLRRRYAAERRFRLLGTAAVALSAAFTAFLLITMVAQGIRGFTETKVTLPVNLAHADLPIEPSRVKGRSADLAWLVPAWRMRSRRPPPCGSVATARTSCRPAHG